MMCPCIPPSSFTSHISFGNHVLQRLNNGGINWVFVRWKPMTSRMFHSSARRRMMMNPGKFLGSFVGMIRGSTEHMYRWHLDHRLTVIHQWR